MRAWGASAGYRVGRRSRGRCRRVVADLGFGPEFNGFDEAVLRDRPGVGVGVADPPGRTIGGWVPARRSRVWAAICRVASRRSVRSSTALANRPRWRPAPGSWPPIAFSVVFLRAARSSRFALASSRSASAAWLGQSGELEVLATHDLHRRPRRRRCECGASPSGHRPGFFRRAGSAGGLDRAGTRSFAWLSRTDRGRSG